MKNLQNLVRKVILGSFAVSSPSLVNATSVIVEGGELDNESSNEITFTSPNNLQPKLLL